MKALTSLILVTTKLTLESILAPFRLSGLNISSFSFNEVFVWEIKIAEPDQSKRNNHIQ